MYLIIGQWVTLLISPFQCTTACRRSEFNPLLKQVVTAPLPNARQQVRVSRVLGDDHYKGLVHITVGVAHKEPSLLNGHECRAYVKFVALHR